MGCGARAGDTPTRGAERVHTPFPAAVLADLAAGDLQRLLRLQRRGLEPVLDGGLHLRTQLLADLARAQTHGFLHKGVGLVAAGIPACRRPALLRVRACSECDSSGECVSV